MMNKINRKEWAEDFQNFLTAKEERPSQILDDAVLSLINRDLNPPAWAVFGKLSLIQTFVGMATLLLCPQFGISILPGMGLMSLFMKFGETACMAACGSIFLGAGALVSSLVLKPEEVKIIRRNRVLQISLLGSMSIGVFICFGASVVATLGFAWFVGSTIGGLATLEFGWFVRSQFRRKLVHGL